MLQPRCIHYYQQRFFQQKGYRIQPTAARPSNTLTPLLHIQSINDRHTESLTRSIDELYSIQTYTAANNQFNVFITANDVDIDPAGLWWLATLSRSPITIEQNEVQVGRRVRTKLSLRTSKQMHGQMVASTCGDYIFNLFHIYVYIHKHFTQLKHILSKVAPDSHSVIETVTVSVTRILRYVSNKFQLKFSQLSEFQQTVGTGQTDGEMNGVHYYAPYKC